MSLKQKALLQLVALIAAGIVGAEIVYFITQYVSKETILDAIQYGCIGVMLYACYSLILSRLEYQETLKNLNKKD
jgi:zinc transporter ZupT